MRILVSNDDGIHARGIRVLAHRLSLDSDNEVYVCAPDRERSATGHALTLHKPIRVEPIEMEGNLKAAWYTTGTPSDCVKFAVGALVQEPIDFVISGINSGPNLGSEIFYSGTVSAAMEGSFLDIPSIAVSASGSGHRHYDTAAEFIARLVKILPKAKLPGKSLLNVNVPNLKPEEIAGVVVTRLGVRPYRTWFEKRVDPRGKIYYWLAGEAIDHCEDENTDAWCVVNNKISVTPIAFHMTDERIAEQLGSWGELVDLMQGVSGISGVNDKGNLATWDAK